MSGYLYTHKNVDNGNGSQVERTKVIGYSMRQMVVLMIWQTGGRQRNLMTVYSDCATFVDVSYVRALTGLGEPQLYAPGTVVGVV